MSPERFLERYGYLAEAPNGIAKLRDLILQLAVRGRLVPQDPNEEPASSVLERIALEKEPTAKKSKRLPPVEPSEVPFELPPGRWLWTRLGEITNYGATERAESSDVDEATWVLELDDVEKCTSRLMKRVTFRERQFKSSKNRFAPGDVLYGKLRPYLDKVLVADSPGVCTTEMVPIRGYPGVKPSFLRWVLKSPYFIAYANRMTHGMNLPRLGTENARLALIPIAPTNEQARIVAKVDQLMALCDELEAKQKQEAYTHTRAIRAAYHPLTTSKDQAAFQTAWQRIRHNFDAMHTSIESVKALRETILQLTVQGKLVPQDPNDEPASVLLERISAKKQQLVADGKIKTTKPMPRVETPEMLFRLPKGWAWSRLHDAIDVRDGTHDSPRDSQDRDSYPLVTSKDFRGGDIDFDGARRISAQDHEEIAKRSLVEADDILFSMIGGNIGNQVLVRDTRPFTVKNVALFKYYDKNLTYPFFIKKYLENLAVRLQAEASGGAQPFVSLGALRRLIIAVPPVAEQHRIVAKVDQLMALCNELESNLQAHDTIAERFGKAVVTELAGPDARDLEE
jgi:type I restriction enzyme S subunit